MPARGRVSRCSLLRTTLADGRCAQRGLSEFVKLPSGRSHRSIPFWDVMHQCALSCCVAALRACFAEGCRAVLVTNAPQRWRNGAAMSLAVLSMLLHSHSRLLLRAKLKYAYYAAALASVLQTASPEFFRMLLNTWIAP